MKTDLYTRPLEELMVDGKVSISYYPIVPDGVNEWGQKKIKLGENWIAEVSKPKHTEARGETPREALIALHKQLDKHI